MSIISALTTLSLFSGAAISQIIAPPCNTTTQYDWSYNSLDQSPCEVAAYMLSTSNNGSWTLGPLTPGTSYPAPDAPINKFHACKCTTVAYSLLSACAGCQGATWYTWSEWANNCTEVFAPSTFPNTVPAGTRVQQWALIDVTLQDDWSPVKSLATGDLPEIGPGTLIGNPSASLITVSSTATSLHSSSTSKSPEPSPNSSSSGDSSSKIGAIVGSVAVIGGVAVISIAIFGTFYLRRRRSRVLSAPLSDAGAQTPPTPTRETHMPLMRVYDPDDPTTFPKYQAPVLSPDGARNTQDNEHAAWPQGYNGLPIVSD